VAGANVDVYVDISDIMEACKQIAGALHGSAAKPVNRA
jgi:hypothetical protein